jgi:hypothetical protein
MTCEVFDSYVPVIMQVDDQCCFEMVTYIRQLTEPGVKEVRSKLPARNWLERLIISPSQGYTFHVHRTGVHTLLVPLGRQGASKYIIIAVVIINNDCNIICSMKSFVLLAIIVQLSSGKITRQTILGHYLYADSADFS